MIRTALAALALFAASLSPAMAASCQPVELVVMQIAATPGAPAPRILAGAPLEKAVEIFHAIPPESDEPLTVAILVDLPDGGGVMLVGQDEMVCGAVRFTPQQWRGLVTTVEGRGV